MITGWEGWLAPLQRSAFVGKKVRIFQTTRYAGAGGRPPILNLFYSFSYQTQEGYIGQTALAFRPQVKYKLSTNAKQEPPQLQSQSPRNCPRHNARPGLSPRYTDGSQRRTQRNQRSRDHLQFASPRLTQVVMVVH